MQRQLLFVLVVFIAGCATTPQQPAHLRTSTSSISINGRRADVSAYRARRMAAPARSIGSSAAIAREVQIRGPVGVGSVRLELRGDPSSPRLTLETADGRKLESTAAWDELEARLGAPVPAGNLRYWILGLAAPGEHQWHEPGPDGVVTLEQGGWRIDYQRYSTEPGARVPVKMSASNGEARVRIVVDRWQLGQ